MAIKGLSEGYLLSLDRRPAVHVPVQFALMSVDHEANVKLQKRGYLGRLWDLLTATGDTEAPYVLNCSHWHPHSRSCLRTEGVAVTWV